jgi:hypothetical protein
MAQVSIRFAAPGTRNYTVGNDVVGGVMKMEAIGAGGAGGTAAVNSGGGGKGGAYARRNAQAVTAGQALTVTVAPSVAAAAGTASSVATGGGTSGTIGQQSFTPTGGSPTAQGAACGITFKISGSPSFVAASSSPSGTITIPAATQPGDLIFVYVGYTVQEKPSPSGYQTVYDGAPSGNRVRVHSKVAVSGDSGKQEVFDTDICAVVCSVYRQATSEFIGAINNQTNTSPLLAPGFSGTTSDRALFFVSMFATTNGSIAPPAGVTERAEAQDSGPSTRFVVSVNDAPLTPQAGTTLLSAAGGNVGGNGSATAGGTGATAQNGTSVGDVTFTGGNGANGTLTAGGRGGGGAGDSSNTTGAGPNTQFGVSGGLGGTSAAAGQVYGGAGGGATTLAARGAGAQGIVVLTYSTGVGTTTATPVFRRRITAFRRSLGATTATAIFTRTVRFLRRLVATVNTTPRVSKFIRNRKIATTAPTARQTRKALRLARSASTSMVSVFTRRIRAFRRSLGTTTATPRFQRLVTLRRRLVATVQARARMLVKLEARLIPREGGGGTVTNVFRNLFLFDD